MRKVSILLCFVCLYSVGFATNRHSKIASVPFEVVGSYIVVKVKINHSSTLHFILDSGLSNTLITELTPEDNISLNYTEMTVLNGLGIGKRMNALTSTGNSFQIGKMTLFNQTVFVLEEDVFNLSKHTGAKINGILGSDFFQGHVVKINYDIKRITFYESSSFMVPENYTPVNISIEGHKMFTNLQITETDDTYRSVKMLVDTGAELTAWFRAYGKLPVQIPAKNIRGYIGQGLNGEVKGYFGRIPQINLGGFALNNPAVSFPDSLTITEAISESGREGIAESGREGTIGSQILSRFNLIFDASKNKIYIKPNYNFKKPFSYNIAGIELIQEDPFLRLPEVLYVWENSPAEHAGVCNGDFILEVNGLKGLEVDINEIKRLFEVSSRKQLRLLLLRGEKTIKINVEMKSAI